MNAIRLIGISFALAAFGHATAGGLEDAIASCNGCHGDDGVSQWNDMPTIAGIDAFVHSDALYAYRDEERPCSMAEFRQGPRASESATMCEVAGALSDKDIEALAEHYAALPFVPAQQDFDADLAADSRQ